MKERIIEFLRSENKSSAQLADEIGVQPSGISHILSGRNNPSLDFILKMLGKYPYLSTDWLLFGKGTMYKDAQMQSLFDEASPGNNEKKNEPAESPLSGSGAVTRQNLQQSIPENDDFTAKSDSKVVRMVWFFADNTFTEYFPKE